MFKGIQIRVYNLIHRDKLFEKRLTEITWRNKATLIWKIIKNK